MQRQELLTTLVLANAFKEGDLALGGTRDEQVHTQARQALAAALALQGTEGFVDRFSAAMTKGAALIDRLNECEGIRVGRFPYGSNIFPVEIDPRVDVEAFLAALRRCWIFLYPDEDNAQQIHLTVNTTLLRQPNEAIVAAFARALTA